jgi:hypothetical protein
MHRFSPWALALHTASHTRTRFPTRASRRKKLDYDGALLRRSRLLPRSTFNPTTLARAAARASIHDEPTLTSPHVFKARLSAAVFIACTACIASSAAYAQTTNNPVASICQARAHNAQLVAQDRDAGITREQEMQKAYRVAGAMPIGRQQYALAEMSQFVDGLYGRYAKVSPQDAYTKYLAYCEGQQSHAPAQ